MKLKIRYKLLLGFALLVILSTIIEGFVFTLLKDYISSQITILLADKAQTAAGEIDNFFTTIQSYNLEIARAYRKDKFTTTQNVATTISNIVETDPFVRNITILTPTGREILKNEEGTGIISEEKLSFEIPTEQFNEAKTGRTTISKIYYLNNQQGPHVDIFSPVYLNNTTVFAIIKQEINLTKVWSIISRIRLGTHGYAYIVDNEGRIIAHPNLSYLRTRPNVSSRTVIASVLHSTQTNNITYTNEKNIQVLAQAVRLSNPGWIIVFEEPVSEAFSFLTYIGNVFLFALGISLFILLIVAVFMSESLTRPIRRLQEAIHLIDLGNLSTQIQIHSHDEIENLADSFNTMTHRLQKREELLEKERNEMETLLQSLTDGVIVIDNNQTILLVNKAAETITSIQTQMVKGKLIDEAIKFTDNNQQIFFKQYQSQSEEIDMEAKQKGLIFTRQDGKNISIALKVAPVFYEDNKQSGWIITFHDITKLRELEEMKLDFVSMAAHELRTPLTAIRGYTSLFQDEYGDKLDATGKQYINRLAISSKNLAGLIDNLLNVSRIERNTFKVELKPVNLVDTIKEAIKNLDEQVHTRRQELTLNIPEKTIPLVFADRERIMQVMTNLLSNAISYTQEGGEIEVSIHPKVQFVEVCVKDNGAGIPEEALPKIFTKFFRVSGILEQGSKGTGLGLFISKSIIDLHHGEIHVDSEEGKGTIFSFTLPVTREVNGGKEETQPSPKPSIGIIYNKEMYERRFGRKLE